jgi:hypothetical protein
MWPILFIVACFVLTLVFLKLIVGGVRLIRGDTEGLIEEEREGFDQYEGFYSRHRAPKSFDDAMEGFEADLSRPREMHGPWRLRDWRANRLPDWLTSERPPSRTPIRSGRAPPPAS